MCYGSRGNKGLLAFSSSAQTCSAPSRIRGVCRWMRSGWTKTRRESRTARRVGKRAQNRRTSASASGADTLAMITRDRNQAGSPLHHRRDAGMTEHVAPAAKPDHVRDHVSAVHCHERLMPYLIKHRDRPPALAPGRLRQAPLEIRRGPLRHLLASRKPPQLPQQPRSDAASFLGSVTKTGMPKRSRCATSPAGCRFSGNDGSGLSRGSFPGRRGRHRPPR